MREDICTIPVSEGFEEKCGCPLCRMTKIAEDKVIDYIMGSAMMEPDVRVMTNEEGFCAHHFGMMQDKSNRLSLALILDSHLAQISSELAETGSIPFLRAKNEKKRLYRAISLGETCFVCEKLNYGMSHMLETVYLTYERDRSFRELFAAQEQLCLRHYTLLMQNMPAKMNREYADELRKTARRLTLGYLKQLRGDVRRFCDMFDYRNSGEDADWGNSRDSIERAIAFLNGELYE